MAPTDTDLAYIAGMLDGEGYIGINKKVMTSRKSPRYDTKVCITNTHKRALDWIQSKLGAGVIYETKQKNNPLAKNRCFVWSCSNKEAIRVLKLLHPYLHIKKLKAETLISFGEFAGRSAFYKPVPDEVNEKRESYYQQALVDSLYERQPITI